MKERGRHRGIGACELVVADRLRVPASWSIGPHRHGFHELVVVERGRQAVVARGRTLVAQPGEVLFYPRGLVHREWVDGGTALESVYVGFHWAGYSAAGMPEHLSDTGGRLQAILTWLYGEREAYFPGALAFRRDMLRALLSEYLRLARQREDALVDRVRAYVRAHLDRPFTLDELAGAVGMSKYYFIRRYRALTGMTPMQDARRIRLEAARQLLLSTDLPLKAIAPRVGVADEYYLSRLLRKGLGVGARELRQRSRGA